MRTEHHGTGEGLAGTGDHGAEAAEVRLRTVEILEDAGAPLSVTDLALELLGARGTDDDLDPDRVNRLRVGLYHRHLPKLDAAGIVEFDPERRSVALARDVATEDIPIVLTA